MGDGQIFVTEFFPLQETVMSVFWMNGRQTAFDFSWQQHHRGEGKGYCCRTCLTNTLIDCECTVCRYERSQGRLQSGNWLRKKGKACAEIGLWYQDTGDNLFKTNHVRVIIYAYESEFKCTHKTHVITHKENRSNWLVIKYYNPYKVIHFSVVMFET